MDRRSWWATVHGVAKKSDKTERPTLSLLCSHCIALQYLVITYNGKEYENEYIYISGAW